MSLFRNKKNSPEIDLVLSASGVRAPCFIGGLEAILEKGYKISRVAGTSGGAVVAASYALGMDVERLKSKAPDTPYETFKDFQIKNILSIKNPSVYTGKELDNFYQEIFGSTKMKDFKIDCRISVVEIIGKKRITISRDNYPDLEVWKAVRMSSTIPFIFPYLELEGTPVTDGALYTKMFDVFPNTDRPLICLRPRADHSTRRDVQDATISKLFLWDYLKIVAEYLVDSIDSQHVVQDEWDRTIIIPTFDIGGFNFNLKPENIESLMQHGYNAVIISDILPYINS